MCAKQVSNMYSVDYSLTGVILDNSALLSNSCKLLNQELQCENKLFRCLSQEKYLSFLAHVN